MQQLEDSIDRYLAALDAADRDEPRVAPGEDSRLKEKIAALKEQMQQLTDLSTNAQAPTSSYRLPILMRVR